MREPAERPLTGVRVVVTRPRAQSAGLVESLTRLGAEVLELPVIRTEAIAPGPAVRSAAARLADYDWLIYTSANAVAGFPPGAGEEKRPRICAIGPATAQALAARGAAADLVPTRAVGEAAAEALLAAGVGRGSRVLFPRAEQVRPVIADALRGAGAEVDEVVVYRTVPDGAGVAEASAALAAGRVAAVTFTSGSTARGFAALVGTDLGGAIAASIGPVTSQALRECGIEVKVEASDHTARGLVRALVEHLGHPGSGS